MSIVSSSDLESHSFWWYSNDVETLKLCDKSWLARLRGLASFTLIGGWFCALIGRCSSWHHSSRWLRYWWYRLTSLNILHNFLRLIWTCQTGIMSFGSRMSAMTQTSIVDCGSKIYKFQLMFVRWSYNIFSSSVSDELSDCIRWVRPGQWWSDPTFLVNTASTSQSSTTKKLENISTEHQTHDRYIIIFSYILKWISIKY